MIDTWTCEHGEKHWNGDACDCSMLDAALDYAVAGYRVFPIKAHAKQPPLTRHGHKDASADPDVVRRFWTLNPDANIGIATGGGLAVIDVDFRSGGTVNPEWPETLTAKTPSGGFHFYFGVPEPVRTSASRIGPGIDVRGEGGYVVAAPSDVDGKPYTWEHVRPIAPATIEMFLPPGVSRSTHPDRPADWTPYDPPERVAEGARNSELVRYAGWLWSMGADFDELLDALKDFNEGSCVPPLADSEVIRVARRCEAWSR